MRKVLTSVFFLFWTASVHSQESVYLQCTVGSSKGGDLFPAVDPGATRDFRIDKTAETITQIITGISDADLENLSHGYSETDTQYVSDDGFISINKYTLEFDISLPFGGGNLSGKCVTKGAVL